MGILVPATKLVNVIESPLGILKADKAVRATDDSETDEFITRLVAEPLIPGVLLAINAAILDWTGAIG